MNRQCSALIYPIVRLSRPQRIIEIGTLFASTAEIFARALWANGDSKFDVVWRNTDGSASMCLMNGAQILTSEVIAYPSVAPTKWNIAGRGISTTTARPTSCGVPTMVRSA